MRSSRHNQRWPRPRDGPSHRLAITVPCCAHFREGPVLAILAMLALKDALCVAPGGSAPLFPFRSAPWPPMFQAGTGKRRLNRTRKPARHDRSHALTTQKGTSWRCGNRGHFGVALTSPFVDAFVAGLDLTAAAFVRVTPKATGRPGYDPKDLLELYIRLSKPRSLHPRLESEANRNLKIIWLLRQSASLTSRPSPTSGASTTKPSAPFCQFVLLCRQMDLFGRELLAVGGTRIKAVNNKDRTSPARASVVHGSAHAAGAPVT